MTESESEAESYDSVKIKNWRHKQSHERDGFRVERIRTFPFFSDPAYDSVAYDLVKTRLSESEASRRINQSQRTFPCFVISLVLLLVTPTT